MHVHSSHSEVRRRWGKDFPSDSESFYLATKPRAYMNSVGDIQPRDLTRVSFIKEAVLANSNLGSSDTWQKGWDRHALPSIPYSPTRPAIWTVEWMTIDSNGGKIVVSGGDGEWYRLTLDCKEQRDQARLLRMMGSVKPSLELPETWQEEENVVQVGKVLTSIGLNGMKALMIERSSWSQSPPSKRRKSSSPPLSPLASPEYEVSVGEPPLSPEQQVPIPEANENSMPETSSAETESTAQNCSMTQICQPLIPPHSTLEDRARRLLVLGAMPLFPPARRDWSQSSLELPSSGPVRSWPPTGWETMAKDAKLLIWEATATSLAWEWNMPFTRRYILDAFQFLALPGTREPDNSSPECVMRYSNFKLLRAVVLKKEVGQAEKLVSMLEVCHQSAVNDQPGAYRTLLDRASKIPLRF